MGLHLGFGRKKKIGKLIGNYIKARVKEKRAFEKELEELDVWLHGKIIDQDAYQRMKDVLEVGFTRQREEALASIQNTFLNTFPFQDSNRLEV